MRRCWASLWTDRAVSYRRHQGIDQQAIKLAVVIQRMVQAEVAGVVFTANPVTGARDEMVVDANPGLGDAVVSGLVTPDHFVLKKRWSGWWIVERRPGKREVIVLPRIEGGTEHISSDRARAPALPDSALLQLVRLCSAIQLHFGSPQDIEWAWSGFGISAPAFDQMFIKKDDVIVQLKHNIAFRPTSGIFLAPARLLRIILHYNPVRWQEDPLLVKIQSHVKDLEARELRTLSWRELLSTLQEAQDIFVDVGELRRRYYPRMGFAAGLLFLILGLSGQGDRFGALMSGVENKTVETNRELQMLAAQIRASSVLAEIFSKHDTDELWKALEVEPSGQAFLAELKRFLDRYGHRESVLSTALPPTWKDEPKIVLGILKSFVLAGGWSQARPQAGWPAW